jgi:hypothetical protein
MGNFNGHHVLQSTALSDYAMQYTIWAYVESYLQWNITAMWFCCFSLSGKYLFRFIYNPNV